MTVVSFIAESAADAVTQIRAKLGPDAVVLNVRRLPVSGVSRLWARPKIEVLAAVPEAASGAAAPVAPDETPAATLLDVREDDSPITIPPVEADDGQVGNDRLRKTNPYSMSAGHTGGWRTPSLLETMGLTPLHAERVMEELKRRNGERAPESLAAEMSLARTVLSSFWRTAPVESARLHVFVGPAGSGKTTALCKWLTQAVLLDGAEARVWRLDTPRANTAESLSVHGEILGTPVERSWNPGAVWPERFLFVDLPGVECHDTESLQAIEKLLSTMPGATVSLVLNAAYETALLQAQIRAFNRLPITSLIFTHLDEEPRWSKLWNFVLGTNYTLSFLGSGQNIPGQFLRATPELLFPAAFRRSSAVLPTGAALASPLLNPPQTHGNEILDDPGRIDRARHRTFVRTGEPE